MWLLVFSIIIFIVIIALIIYANRLTHSCPSKPPCHRCGMPKPRCRCPPKNVNSVK